MRLAPAKQPKALAPVAALLLVLGACTATISGEDGTVDEVDVVLGDDTGDTEEDTAAPATSAADDTDADGDDTAEELFPDVVGATASQSADGTWSFSATLSSPYDTPARYADAWRVVGPDGTVYGVRELAHDHANEQPFTRSLGGVEVPDEVTEVTIEGRDQVSGWGGQTTTVALER